LDPRRWRVGGATARRAKPEESEDGSRSPSGRKKQRAHAPRLAVDPSGLDADQRRRPLARRERPFALRAERLRRGISPFGSTATRTVRAFFAAASMESSIISPPFSIACVHAKRGLTNAFAVSVDCLDFAIGILLT
jgi:hypothetical protein